MKSFKEYLKEDIRSSNHTKITIEYDGRDKTITKLSKQLSEFSKNNKYSDLWDENSKDFDIESMVIRGKEIDISVENHVKEYINFLKKEYKIIDTKYIS